MLFILKKSRKDEFLKKSGLASHSTQKSNRLFRTFKNISERKTGLASHSTQKSNRLFRTFKNISERKTARSKYGKKKGK